METKVKERPILFSASMVRAILAGRKTQTRRVIAFPPRGAFVLVETRDGSLWPYASDDGESQVCDDGCEHPMSCPYGAPGDRLWVRETFLTRCAGKVAHHRAAFTDSADAAGFGAMYGGWKPSIFMPRWASRLTLEVVSVRVERLQEITETDAAAEGIAPLQMDNGDARPRFEGLWDTINGKRAPWSSNPWVWVVEFREVTP
jgi:hypothetical protein